MHLDEFLERLRKAAEESDVVTDEELLVLGATRVKVRFNLNDGSYVDVFYNEVLNKQYYHWQKQNGKIYRVNNYPTEGWHEHIDVEERKRSISEITPEQFFKKVKDIMS